MSLKDVLKAPNILKLSGNIGGFEHGSSILTGMCNKIIYTQHPVPKLIHVLRQVTLYLVETNFCYLVNEMWLKIPLENV